jgi:hypothetical protein
VTLRPLRPAARLRLWWGKARRLYLGVFRPRYVRTMAARRVGTCLRCGACCQLGLSCWLLKNDPPLTECLRHTLRPLNCRVFPIDERDLRDRDLIAPHTPCGFSFNGRVPAASPPSPGQDTAS